LESHHVTENNKEKKLCEIHKIVPPLKHVGGMPKHSFLPLYSTQ